MLLRHDRRRRVLSDELSNSATADDLPAGAGPLTSACGLRYAPAAQRENQPRLVDFVPLRALPFALIFGTGLILIAALLAVHAWLPDFSAYVPADCLGPLDLSAQHNLATWFASLLLLSNMQLALLVYSVRKHRVDDYHGRYRIWLAMAVASVAASVDLATGVDRLLKVALAPAARWCGVAEHWGFWTAIGVVATYLTMRLVLETRRAPCALMTFVLAGISFALPTIVGQNVLTFELPAQAVMFRVGLQLAGCLLLLTGTMLFARHVMLDVEGKLPKRKTKQAKPTKQKKPQAQKEMPGREATIAAVARLDGESAQKPKPQIGVRTDLDSKPRSAPLAPKPTFVPSRPVPSVAPSDEDDDENDPTTDLRNLSRADRKRLKREAKLARRAA